MWAIAAAPTSVAARGLERWRSRSRGARAADAVLAACILLLAIAVISSTKADVRDLRRIKVDVTAYRRFAAANPQLGSFGPPAVKVHSQLDEVCAFRRPDAPARHVTEGYCIQVLSRTTSSSAIVHQYRCVMRPRPPAHVAHPAPPVLPRGGHFCPSWQTKIT